MKKFSAGDMLIYGYDGVGRPIWVKFLSYIRKHQRNGRKKVDRINREYDCFVERFYFHLGLVDGKWVQQVRYTEKIPWRSYELKWENTRKVLTEIENEQVFRF